MGLLSKAKAIRQRDEIDKIPDADSDSIITNIKKVDGILIVTVHNYLDTYNSKKFRQKVCDLINQGNSRLILEVEKLTYVSSSGIGALTEIFKAVRHRGGDMVLVKVHEKVMSVLQILGFEKYFAMADTIEEALNYFGQKEDVVQSLFPKVFECSACGKKLQVRHSGKFRCPQCKIILQIDEAGELRYFSKLREVC